MSAEKLRELKTLASVCPELNMANYGEDDVRHLNDWAIEMSLLVEQYALSQQPATGEPVLTVEREPDYWSGGHFYEGSRPHINPTKVWSLPIGTELYTRPVPSVPEGYALVPIEPTQAMMNVQTWDFSSFYSPREIWAAMLAAKDSK